MAYSKSTSKNDLEVRLAALRRTARYVAHKNKKIRSDVRDLVFHSVIFQLSAAFEDYISSIVRAWMFQAVKNGLASGHLPELTRAYFLLLYQKAGFVNFALLGDEKKLLKKLSPTNQAFAFVNDGSALTPLASGGRLLDGRKFPSTDNIEALFVRLGIDNVFGAINGAAKADLRLAYESFISVRTALAHASPPPLTIQDVERHWGTVDKIARIIDRLLYRHIMKHSGAACW